MGRAPAFHLALLSAVGVPVVVALAQVNCQELGNQTSCSNGQTSQQFRSQTFNSRGASWQHFGNQTFGSNGSNCHRVGNQLFCR
jgi:hypothetical protein